MSGTEVHLLNRIFANDQIPIGHMYAAGGLIEDAALLVESRQVPDHRSPESELRMFNVLRAALNLGVDRLAGELLQTGGRLQGPQSRFLLV